MASSLQFTVLPFEERRGCRWLYCSIEHGILELDDLLRERTAVAYAACRGQPAGRPLSVLHPTCLETFFECRRKQFRRTDRLRKRRVCFLPS
jgi:hypothetical protein